MLDRWSTGPAAGSLPQALIPRHLVADLLFRGRKFLPGSYGHTKSAVSRCMGQCAFRWTRSEMAEPRRELVNDSFVTPPPSTSDRFSFPRFPGPVEGGFILQTRFNDQGVLEPVLSEEQLAHCEAALKLLLEKTQEPAGRKRLYAEFQALQMDLQALSKSYSVAQDGVNDKKNRYMDVLPFDDTRVTLRTAGRSSRSSTNYINASHIVDDAADGLPRYIATQAPLESTVQDFWEMVFQQRTPAIIMLSRPEDDRREVQAPYFPPNVGESLISGRLQVINRSVEQCQNPITLRTYEVVDTKNQEPSLSVLHLEYLSWPDHGVPRVTVPVRELVRILYQIPKDIGPFAVHCSAGIGRTGTFISINSTVNRILLGDLSAIDIQNSLAHFRNYRAGMVQTSEQYRFIYQAVIEELQDLISTGRRASTYPSTAQGPYHVPWSQGTSHM